MPTKMRHWFHMFRMQHSPSELGKKPINGHGKPITEDENYAKERTQTHSQPGNITKSHHRGTQQVFPSQLPAKVRFRANLFGMQSTDLQT